MTRVIVVNDFFPGPRQLGGGSTSASFNPSTPPNAYVAEDGVTPYVAEDGITFYVTES